MNSFADGHTGVAHRDCNVNQRKRHDEAAGFSSKIRSICASPAETARLKSSPSRFNVGARRPDTKPIPARSRRMAKQQGPIERLGSLSISYFVIFQASRAANFPTGGRAARSRTSADQSATPLPMQRRAHESAYAVRVPERPSCMREKGTHRNQKSPLFSPIGHIRSWLCQVPRAR